MAFKIVEILKKLYNVTNFLLQKVKVYSKISSENLND